MTLRHRLDSPSRRNDTLDEDAYRELQDGVGAFASVLRLKTSDIDDLRARGLAMLRANKLESSLAVFQMLEALGDRSAAVYFALATCCDSLGDREAAERYFALGLAFADEEHAAELKECALTWGAHLVARGES